VTDDNAWGIWSGRRSGLALTVRAGDQAPGTTPNKDFHSFSHVTLNDSGRIAFLGYLKPDSLFPLTDDLEGVWSNGSGSLQLLAQSGSRAPGTPAGIIFLGGPGSGGTFSRPVINNEGKVAFVANLSEEGMPNFVDFDRGIYSDLHGSLQLIVREGDQAPDLPLGVLIDDLPLEPPSLNNLGQLAFAATLRRHVGGVTADNDAAIWAQDRNGDLRLVIRKGDSIDVDNGPDVDLRTVTSSLFLPGSGNQDGTPNFFNDLGQLVFRAEFSDGSAGVFVWSPFTIPEPASLHLVVLVLSLSAARFRRRVAHPLPN
jgi:hypothetical protein